MKSTLLIIAAGMGSRYGGLKQIDPVGPNGEIIIDYSMYDAIAAGFEKIVFVIRHYFEDAFREKIGSKFDGIAETAYAYQELESCLDGFALPSDREKPWGTSHAILVAKDVIDEPFAVINADDYYGPNSFRTIKQYLSDNTRNRDSQYCMVGYKLENTLSECGTVARGVCECDDQMFLKGIVERTNIEKSNKGATHKDQMGEEHFLRGEQMVSMNLWGFGPSIFGLLEKQFKDFLKESGRDNKAECFIPTVIDNLIKEKQIRVKVLTTQDSWFGITYKQDMLAARECVRKLIEQGVYPERLWNG